MVFNATSHDFLFTFTAKAIYYCQVNWSSWRLDWLVKIVQELKGICNDSNNIFLWQKSEDINKRGYFRNFTWFLFFVYKLCSIMQNLKIAISCGNRRKFKILLRKFKISEFRRVFSLYRKKMTIQTCSVSFSCKVWRCFSKWWLKISKNWKKLQQPHHPLTLTAYHTPG